MTVTALPVGLPQLRPGRHANLEDGACLMEYVSVLAGEPFSDHPRCVDELLTRMAWWSNDQMEEANRFELLMLAPRFIGTSGLGARVAPALVSVCCSFALARTSPGTCKALRAMQRRADTRLNRLGRHSPKRSSRLSDRRYRGAHAELELRLIVDTMGRLDTALLPQLLDVALSAVAEIPCAPVPIERWQFR